MRDPWKLLALLLALVLGLVILFRSPVPPHAPQAAAPAGTAQRSADESAAELNDLSGSVPIRETAQESSTTGDIALLVRLVHPDGTPAQASFNYQGGDGATQWTKMRNGLGALVGLRPGPARIRIQGSGYYDRTEEVILPAVPSEQELTLIAEPSANVEVRFLTPDGRRLLDALKDVVTAERASALLPTLYATDDGALPALTPTDRHGYPSRLARWTPTRELVPQPQSDADGFLSLSMRPPMVLHALVGARQVGMLALEAPAAGLEFRVDPALILAATASFRVRVVDGRTGQPAAKTYARLDGAAGASLIAAADDGSLSAANLRPGACIIECSAEGLGPARHFVLLKPGAETDAGEIRLFPPASASFRLTDPEGRPVPKARVWAWDLRAVPQLFQTVHFYYASDEAGEVEVGRVPPTEHVFSFVPPAASQLGAAAARHVPGAGSGPVDVRLRPGIPVTLLAASDDGRRHQVWILVDGYAPAGEYYYDALPATISLAPGEHAWVVVDSGGGEVRRGALRIEEGMTELRVEVPLP